MYQVSKKNKKTKKQNTTKAADAGCTEMVINQQWKNFKGRIITHTNLTYLYTKIHWEAVEDD